MLYVDEDPEYWSKKHGIEIELIKCCGCKEEIIVNVPIVMKGYKGFQMQKHGCPENNLAAVFVPVGEEKKWWQNLFRSE